MKKIIIYIIIFTLSITPLIAHQAHEKSNFSFFSLPGSILIHAIFMILTTGLILAAAIIAFNYRKKKWWLFMHKQLNSIAILISIISFVIIFKFKSDSSMQHISTEHGIMGITALSLLIISAIIAQISLLKKIKRLRIIHKWTGRFTIVIVVLTLSLKILNIYGII